MIVGEKVKFAIIGAGHIGKRHAEMVLRNEDAELIAICDIKKKEELGLENFDVPYFDSVEAMLDSGLDFDVVNICSPNGLHAKHSVQALEQRKHIVCEKPMGLTKAECEQVIYTSLRVSRQVFCVMQNRYSPPSAWIKDVIERGIMGKIFMVQLNCYWNRDERYYKAGSWKGSSDLDGGTLFTQFSHFIDIMFWLFGDIKEIQGKFDDFTHQNLTAFEDSGFVNFRFVN